MNAMMPVSHRLFAAAVGEAPEIRRTRPGRPVVIEMARSENGPGPKARRTVTSLIARNIWAAVRG